MFPISSASLTTPAEVASASIDLSPVANFLLTVSQAREQLTQLHTALANGAQPREAAASLNDAAQNLVNAFNLLPSVDFNQAQSPTPSLLTSRAATRNS
ncbi:hypothetical protein GTP91_29925 [Rugamonas sp. FT82W]|uniref:Uncharacterized protein n=1 Tax=Duganella vulcania TaxID=2692166 RepID=A0A845G9N5_9BURK|nr:hypothetical protein [Duganella vulcania]MYM91383.1 hypothetical protein [Duganella vulcania]